MKGPRVFPKTQMHTECDNFHDLLVSTILLRKKKKIWRSFKDKEKIELREGKRFKKTECECETLEIIFFSIK